MQTEICTIIKSFGKRGDKQIFPKNSIALLIMSLESVFSIVFGWLILHQSMPGRQLSGCILIFSAVIMATIPKKSFRVDFSRG